MKKIHYLVLSLLLVTITFALSCDGGDSGGNSGRSVRVEVVDESNQPIALARVSCGDVIATTDSQGIAELENISATDGKYKIEAEASNYFINYQNVLTIDGSDQTAKIVLLQKNVLGTLNAASGGTVGVFGLRVIAPANGFTKADGSLYTGMVTVAARYVNVDNPILPSAMPGGDFAATNANGEEGGMRTYGFVATQFTDTEGELLTANNNVKFAVNIPARGISLMDDNEEAWGYDPATGQWNSPTTIEVVGSEFYLPVTTLYTNIDLFVQMATLVGRVTCPNGDAAPFVAVEIESPFSKYIAYTNGNGKFKASVESTNGAWSYTVTPLGGTAIGTNAPANTTTTVNNLAVPACAGGGNEVGTGQFTVGSTYSGPCIAVPATGGCGGNDVVITTGSGASFVVYNMPTASSGSFSLTDGWETVGSCELYALTNTINGTQYASLSGTLVKTGPNSFTLSGVMFDIITETSINVTASGTY